MYSFLLSVKASKSDRLLLVLFSRTLVMLKFLVKNLEFGIRIVEQFVMFQNQSVGSRFSVKALLMGYVIFVKDLRSFLVKELFRWNKKTLSFLARTWPVWFRRNSSQLRWIYLHTY